jgi:hypothetical protein
MVRLTADEATMAVLRMAKELAEIRDSNGTVVGFFAPVGLERAHHYAQAAATNPSNLQRGEQSQEGGELLHVVLARLRMLEQEIARRKAAGEMEFTTEESLAYFRSLREQGLPPVSTVPVPGLHMETGGCATP